MSRIGDIDRDLPETTGDNEPPVRLLKGTDFQVVISDTQLPKFPVGRFEVPMSGRLGFNFTANQLHIVERFPVKVDEPEPVREVINGEVRKVIGHLELRQSESGNFRTSGDMNYGFIPLKNIPNPPTVFPYRESGENRH